jgi:hypothetical protein
MDNVGAAGEPCEPGPIDGRDFDKKPAWNRLGFETSNDDASGKMSEGLESSPESLPKYDGGAGISTAFSGDVCSGVDSYFFGVFSKSARVPTSPSSSRQRTARLAGDFFFTGVKDTPFRALSALRRRGEPLVGDRNI